MLDGIRIISLAQQYPGPYCTMLLADLGADVILIEQPEGGDPGRGPDGMRPFFAALNRNKRSLTLNLKSPEGAGVLWRLLDSADALLEGFRPGVMERLGFGHEAVLKRRPTLAYVSISGYGQDGPDRLLPGHDLSYQGRAGLLGDVAAADARRGGLAIADLSSAMFAGVGTLAALVSSLRNGVGHHVDVSMTEGLVSWHNTILEAVLNGQDLTIGTNEPGYGVFACGDGGRITLSIAFEDHFWRALCGSLGWDGPDTALSGPERQRDRDRLRAAIAAELLTRPAAAWLTRLKSAGVPCGSVSNYEEVTRDEQFVTRELFVRGPGEAGGDRWFVANPLRIDGCRPPVRRPAPALGVDTVDILNEAGYSSAEITEFRAKQIV